MRYVLIGKESEMGTGSNGQESRQREKQVRGIEAKSSVCEKTRSVLLGRISALRGLETTLIVNDVLDRV